jgi:hypothetical protein
VPLLGPIATPVRRRSVRAGCLHPPPSRPAAVPEPGPAGGPAALDAPHQPTDLAHGLLQQVGVGWVVDVGLDHGGVHPQLAAPQQLVAGQLAQQSGNQLVNHLGASTADQLDQRGRMRHRPVHPQHPGSYNSVIQPQTRTQPPASAQLTGYFRRDLLRSKEH